MSDKEIIHTHHNKEHKTWHMLALLIPSIIFVLLIVAFSRSTAPVSTSSVKAVHNTPKPKITVQVGSQLIYADVADTEASRTIGLSDRSSLPADEGMLFVFDGNNNYPLVFWMKGVVFPIDILWIDDGAIVQVNKNVLPEEPGTPENDMALYPANQEVDYVLEVNAGFSDSYNIVPGTPVEFTLN